VRNTFVDMKFMNEHPDGRPIRKQRSGVCHRCGWTQPVSKVGRADRQRLVTSFRRLCDECFDDLCRNHVGNQGSKASRQAKLRVLRHRDVA
jgi:hypothetical protein